MTDLILASNKQLTMSSREIAEVVESRHDKVKQSIERLADRGLVTFTPVGEKSQIGRPGVVYHVNKRDSYVIVAQLSPEFTARLVDRWQELESKAIEVPKTLPEALRLAADLAEKNDQLMVVARHQGDRIKALQNLFDGGVTPFEFAKRLNGVNCQRINSALAARGWLFTDSFGNWRASSKARDLYLTERSGRVARSDGRAMVTATPVLLQRGAALLHKLYLHEQLPMKKSWNGVFTHEKALEVGA